MNEHPIGPIDLASNLPPGCLCNRECWDRILASIEEYGAIGEELAAHYCPTHQATHRFKVDDHGHSIVEHPSCPLEYQT